MKASALLGLVNNEVYLKNKANGMPENSEACNVLLHKGICQFFGV
jgi:hypothetical protein